MKYIQNEVSWYIIFTDGLERMGESWEDNEDLKGKDKILVEINSGNFIWL